MRDLDFSNDNLSVQWQYVKRNLGKLGVLYQFDDFESQAHGIIQSLIQSCVNEEFALQVRAMRYEHTPHRLDERQGGYERNLTTTFGASRIRIPRVRFNKVKIHYSLFEKYQRRQKSLIRRLYWRCCLGYRCVSSVSFSGHL